MRGIVTIGVALVAVLLGGILIREDPHATQDPYRPAAEEEPIGDPPAAVLAFAGALRHATVGSASAPNHIAGPAAFQSLHAHLEASYPAVFRELQVQRVSDLSLLLTWPGTDPSLRPVALLSHLDVVPAPPENWTHPPFSGTVADGYVWGRGAMDTKNTLCGILEAVEQILGGGGGARPRRTLLLAFGHDEEVGGEFGAAKIVEELKSRGVTELELLLDEGGLVKTDGVAAGGVPLLTGPFAGVGTATKGAQSWRIHITGEGGHSSVPPTGIGSSVPARVAKILMRLETTLTATRLVPPTVDFVAGLAPAVRWAPLRALLGQARHPIINPALSQALGAAGHRELSAMVRTTVAVIAVQVGGTKHAAGNVQPSVGSIDLNFRLLPGEDPASVEQYLRGVVLQPGDGAWARLERLPGEYPASAVTPATGPVWDLAVRAISETLAPKGPGRPQMPVVPMLIVGGTDALWYEDLAPGRALRFSPLRLTTPDVGRFHGVDERVRVGDYLDGVRFYERFIRLAVMEAGAGTGTG